MPKIRGSCCLCQQDLEYNGERYVGVKFARTMKKTEAMARHLGLSLNEMGVFKDHAEICHRHYNSSAFKFVTKTTGNIRKSLVLNADVLPNFDRNHIVRLKLQEKPSVLPLPGSHNVQHLISLFSNGVEPPVTVRLATDTTVSSATEQMANDTATKTAEQPDVEMYDHDFEVPSPIPDVSSKEVDESDEEIEYEYFRMPNFLLTEGKQLLQLFQRCFDCGTRVTAIPSSTICGTAITIKFWCKTCKCYKKWSSQSKVKNTERFLGNVLVPSTAVLTPINYSSLSEFSQTLGLPMIKWSTFNRVARRTHEIIVDEWQIMQDKIVGDIIKKQEEGEETCVSADCQFDSRGYCASQGCETIMCSKSKLVITGHLLERSETNNNSGAMEVEGLKRGLAELKAKKIKVKVLTTDRSVSIITFMLQFKEIVHLFDSWHLFKSLNKSFREASKLKSAPEMKIWIGPLLNHMWYSVKAANGDGNRCIEFMMIPLLHSLGVHEWQPGRLEDVLREVHSKFTLKKSEKPKYKKNNPSLIPSSYVKDFNITLSRCPHSYRAPNIVEDNRLPVFSKVYNVILKTLTRENTVKDMMRVSPNLTTSALENLHSLITGKYRSKDVYYPKHHSQVLTYLAYYHHNMNIYDEMEGSRYYVRKRMVKSRQKGGERVVKYVKNSANLSWKIRFNEQLLDRYSHNFVTTNNIVLDDEEEECAVVECLRIRNEFDEALVDDIIEGNICEELIDLLQESEENEEPEKNLQKEKSDEEGFDSDDY